jgi:hypothetical protein
VGFRGHLQTRLNFLRTFVGNSTPCPLMYGTGRTLSFVFGPPSEQTLASESKFGTHGRTGSLRWLPPCYVLRYDPDVLSLCRADDSLVAVLSAGGATSETVMRAAKEDRQGLPAYFGRQEQAASVTRLVEARATASWEKFLRRERRMLETRKNGQLAKAILVRLPLEAQEEREQMTSEDRKRAEEALVALRSEQGELSSYKHLDDFTPEDCMNRIRAEMRRMEWLLERQTKRNALLRSTAF